MKRLHLDKIKNQQNDLRLHNVFIVENVIPFNPNRKSVLNEFDITNHFLHEYIIKTNTNSLTKYDIAVTNLGTVLYDSSKFENFILCLDNTNRFMITAKYDNIPRLWEDGYYKVNAITLDYIVHSSNMINGFGIFNILNLQFLLYYDYKKHTHKQLFNKSYHYNFIEFLCSNFFKDITNVKFISIRNIIVSMYESVYQIKFKENEIKKLTSEILYNYRKSSKKHTSDFKLFIDLRNQIMKLYGEYSKVSMFSLYERKTNRISSEVSTFINRDLTGHLSYCVKSFVERIFNSNYILSKIYYIKYQIEGMSENDIYDLLIKYNPDINKDFIKELFDIKSLIRFASGKYLTLSMSLQDIYQLISKHTTYMNYLYHKYDVKTKLNIPLCNINISYYLIFKDIDYLRVQKFLLNDKYLRSMLYNYSYFQNTGLLLIPCYDYIRRFIMQVLIDTLYHLSEPFVFLYRSNRQLQRRYAELTIEADYNSYLNKLRDDVIGYCEYFITQESIDGFYMLNRMDLNYKHTVSDLMDIKTYVDLYSKKNFKIGCLSSMSHISKIITRSDSILYLIDHNDNSLQNYNYYFFDNITKRILNEFKNPN